MISLEERQMIAAMIEQARCEGARLKAACEVGGIDARTLQRRENNTGLRDGDARPSCAIEADYCVGCGAVMLVRATATRARLVQGIDSPHERG